MINNRTSLTIYDSALADLPNGAAAKAARKVFTRVVTGLKWLFHNIHMSVIEGMIMDNDWIGQKPADANSLLLIRAVNFAAQKHKHQRRKGEAGEAYFAHLSEVATLLAENTDASDTNMIIAGYLHDTIEDVDVTYPELAAGFGKDVADLVMEVTDDKRLPKEERKRLQIVTAPHKSQRAKMIKIADKISNLRAIMTTPPVDWDTQRKREYFEWSKKVFDGCKGANAGLEMIFLVTYKKGIKSFGAEEICDHECSRRTNFVSQFYTAPSN